jgi:hypothetical protein
MTTIKSHYEDKQGCEYFVLDFVLGIMIEELQLSGVLI